MRRPSYFRVTALILFYAIYVFFRHIQAHMTYHMRRAPCIYIYVCIHTHTHLHLHLLYMESYTPGTEKPANYPNLKNLLFKWLAVSQLVKLEAATWKGHVAMAYQPGCWRKMKTTTHLKASTPGTSMGFTEVPQRFFQSSWLDPNSKFGFLEVFKCWLPYS